MRRSEPPDLVSKAPSRSPARLKLAGFRFWDFSLTSFMSVAIFGLGLIVLVQICVFAAAYGLLPAYFGRDEVPARILSSRVA